MPTPKPSAVGDDCGAEIERQWKRLVCVQNGVTGIAVQIRGKEHKETSTESWMDVMQAKLIFFPVL